MGALEALALVGKILCFVIGGALVFGAGMTLFINGVDFEEKENSATRLKAEVFLTGFFPMIIAFLPWEGLWSALVPIAYVVVMFLYWSAKRDDIVRFRENWREMIVVRRVFISGIVILLAGVALSWMT